MAFPIVAATNGGNSGGNTTSHLVNLPTMPASVGSLLIVLFSVDGNPSVTWPSGWSSLFATANGSTNRLEARYRVADGTEVGTITLTTSASEGSAHTTYRITGHNSSTDPPEAGISATGTNTNPDPPSLTPTGGAKDYLWLAVQGNDGNRSTDAYPTNYTNGINNRWASANGVGVGSARRLLNAASDNPGTFTISSSDDWVAQTLAVHPGNEGIGQTFERAPDDSVSVTDTSSRTTSFGLLSSDTVAVTDQATRNASFNRTDSDSVSVADVLALVECHCQKSLADLASVTDTNQAASDYYRSTSDTVSVTDFLTTKVEFERTNSDTAAVTDQTSPTFERSASDTVSVTDFLLEEDTQVREVQDTVSVVDFVAASLGESAVICNSVVVTDDTIRATDSSRTLINVVLVTDNHESVTHYVRSSADVVTTTDSVQAFNEVVTYVADVVMTTDQVTRRVTFERLVGPDVVSVTDLTTEEDFEHRHLNDVAGTTDAVTVQLELERHPVDAVVVTELFRKEAAYSRPVFDAEEVTDHTLEADFYSRSLSDTVFLTESSDISVDYVRRTNDSVGVTDDLQEEDTEIRRLQDEVVVTEVLIVVTDYIRRLQDVVVVNDSNGPEVGKAADDSVGTSDSLSTATHYHRLPSDIGSVSDLVRPSTQYVRPTTDLVTASDVAVVGTTRDVVGFELPVTVCFGAGQTGLRPLIEILDASGAVVVLATQAGLLELGGGCYGVGAVIPANLFGPGDSGWIRLRRNPTDTQPEVFAFELPTGLVQPTQAFVDQVRDSVGNLVPRATIRVFKPNTLTLIFQTQADDEGRYLIPLTADALLGIVDLEFSAPGIQAIRKSAVKLSG